MIHIYTGEGKGKTTAALGLALRALGWNFKICICQFLKSKDSRTGELIALKKNKNYPKLIKIINYNQKHPIFYPANKLKKELVSKLKTSIKKSIIDAKKLIKSKKYKMVVLDEIINTVTEGFITEDFLIDLIKSSPNDVELILSGRGATKRMIKLADYVTEMKQLKHPFKNKIYSRKGIEF